VTATSSAPTVAAFGEALARGDLERAGRIAAALHRSELGRALLGLAPAEAESLYTGLGDQQLAALIRKLRSTDAADVLRRLSDAAIADVIDELPPDEAADVIEAIKSVQPERVGSILVEMDRAGDVEALLAFLPETAGGRMTSDFLTVRPETTAAEAIGTLRERTQGRSSEFRSYIYVTDEARQLLGVVPLYQLVIVDPHTRVADFMVPDPIRVQGTDDQREVGSCLPRAPLPGRPGGGSRGSADRGHHRRRRRRCSRPRSDRGHVPHGRRRRH
jgi:magnesium transporter